MDKKMITEGITMILKAIGEDIGRPGLRDTPRRIASMYEHIFAGIAVNPCKEVRVLEDEKHDEIVLVRDIPFYSICEHHLLPFIGKAHVAYIPDGRITGLSKIARVVDTYSRRPQVQERLTTQIADCLDKVLKPKGVMVIIEAEHLCITMRGIRKPGSIATTSVVRGIFRSNPATRNEALTLIGPARGST